MLKPPIPNDEKERLTALKNLNILDTPLNPLLERITRLTKAFFKVPMVSITLIDSERQWFKSTQGMDICENSRELSFCAYAILQDDIYVVTNTLTDPKFSEHPMVINPPFIRFYAGYPIRSTDGYKIGTLCIIDRELRTFTRDELLPLKDMAGLVEEELRQNKQSFVQSKMIQELNEAKRKQYIDSLSRIWNRGGTENLLNSQILISRENKSCFGVIMVDIDDFKHVNDTYGHAAGDEVIREVAKRLVESFRETDIVGRWGGEEFLAIIGSNNNDPKEVLKYAETARSNICDTAIQFEDKELKISITLGVTLYTGGSETGLELVKQADDALYQGKKKGKNQCTFLPL